MTNEDIDKILDKIHFMGTTMLEYGVTNTTYLADNKRFQTKFEDIELTKDYLIIQELFNKICKMKKMDTYNNLNNKFFIKLTMITLNELQNVLLPKYENLYYELNSYNVYYLYEYRKRMGLGGNR